MPPRAGVAIAAPARARLPRRHLEGCAVHGHLPVGVGRDVLGDYLGWARLRRTTAGILELALRGGHPRVEDRYVAPERAYRRPILPADELHLLPRHGREVRTMDAADDLERAVLDEADRLGDGDLGDGAVDRRTGAAQ